MRASHRSARTTSGWRKRAPHIPSERRALLARCGKKAFLDPKRLRFPIMARTGRCVIDCEGLRAAKSRAAQFGHKKIAAKAERKGKHLACVWA